MEDFELTLYDRLEVIRNVNKEYDLEKNAYIGFSGGKDSTVIHYLIDLALPNNNIPRVFINTGIEYNDIVNFVEELQKNDDRFVIVKPSKPILKTLETYGYPFKSKKFSNMVDIFNRRGMLDGIKKFVADTRDGCPKKLQYIFEEQNTLGFPVSNKCCDQLKKQPSKKWRKENGKNITITGIMSEEGGTRKIIKGCIVDRKKENYINFHPLLVCSKEFEQWFIEKYNVKLCKLYYPPYNFRRTGCKGCPFALKLKDQLDVMEEHLPNERKQCEVIWKPVYEEYRRIGYRLKER